MIPIDSLRVAYYKDIVLDSMNKDDLLNILDSTIWDLMSFVRVNFFENQSEDGLRVNEYSILRKILPALKDEFYKYKDYLNYKSVKIFIFIEKLSSSFSREFFLSEGLIDGNQIKSIPINSEYKMTLFSYLF